MSKPWPATSNIVYCHQHTVDGQTDRCSPWQSSSLCYHGDFRSTAQSHLHEETCLEGASWYNDPDRIMFLNFIWKSVFWKLLNDTLKRNKNEHFNITQTLRFTSELLCQSRLTGNNKRPLNMNIITTLCESDYLSQRCSWLHVCPHQVQRFGLRVKKKVLNCNLI